MKRLNSFLLGAVCLLASCGNGTSSIMSEMSPVDYVNPYMGNISHLLVPTFPTIHLPNSMLRVYPERSDYTADKIKGLPLIVTNHRERSAFNLTPYQGDRDGMKPVIAYTYDHERITPYSYSVYLDEPGIEVSYAPSHQSAVYQLEMSPESPSYLIFNSREGAVKVNDNAVSGYQQLVNNTKVYIYLETSQKPLETMVLKDGKADVDQKEMSGKDACVALYYGDKGGTLNVRYGVSFISEEQARKNLEREISGYDVAAVAAAGRESGTAHWVRLK